jgi:DNA sulfur modification protein DndD
MKINSITINNFQSYYEEQTIEFGDGLNLIIGNGGKGKSKLFNAFYWVLFGKIYVTSEGWCTTDDLYLSSHKALHKFEYINKKALYDAKIDGKVDCYVQLDLTDDKGHNYIIERQASAIRQPVQEWDKPESWNVSPSSLKVTYDVATGTKNVNGIMAESIITDLFPEGIRGYIWFQGESLDSLIDFRKKQNLKDAVRHISYYPYYEKLTSIISKAKAKIESQESRKLREANKQNSEIRSLILKIDFLRGKIQTEEENKKKYENNIAQIEIALADDETKMQGLAGFSKLIKDYDECEKEILRINNQLTEIDNSQRSLLPSLWILRGTDKLIEKSKEIISSHVELETSVPEKKYIDEPSRAKLEDILNKDHQCFVCGSPVDEAHPHAVEWILNRLRMQEEYYKELDDFRNNLEFSKQFNMLVGKIQDYPDFVLRSLKGIDRQFQETEEEMDRLIAKRRKQLEKKTELDKQIENVKQKYGVDPHREASTVPTLTSNIRASRGNLEKQRKLLESCKSAISDYTRQQQDAERELNSMGANNTGTVTQVAETEWKHISTFLEAVCKDVQEKARKELLKKIEERANEFYEKFTEHDKGYKGRVEIDEDYTITFDGGLNTSHEDRKKMSIINALLSLNQDALQTYYPFISDAPTSSFDPSTTHKYLLGIKDIFGQSIIMTKDVEVGSDKYRDLYNQDNVSRILQLDSQIYRDDAKEPEIWEVSTIVKSLK